MRERVTIRCDDEWRACLSDAAHRRGMDRSSLVRQAIIGKFKGTRQADPMPSPPHDREACARAWLTACLPEVHERVGASGRS